MTTPQDSAAKLDAEEAAIKRRRDNLERGRDTAATVRDTEPEPEVIAGGEYSTDLVTPDDEPLPWEHRVIEFYGEQLEVRKPTEQALAGFSLASGKYVPQKLQNDLVSLFVKQHMSERSMERVFFRLLDPDDSEYTPATIGELMRDIALLK